MRLPFGAYIKKLRQQHQLTLRVVAATIDIDQSSLAKIEKAQMIAPEYIIKPMSALYQIDFRELQIHYLRDKLVQLYEQVPHILEGLEEAIQTLQSRQTSSPTLSSQIAQQINNYFMDKPVERVWLFGSAVREAMHADSDIDLLVELSDHHNLDLFDYMEMSDDLSQLVDRPVDLVVDGQLDELIAPQVHAEKALIYEQK